MRGHRLGAEMVLVPVGDQDRIDVGIGCAGALERCALGRRFLIDAPIREGLAPYATSPAAERASLEGARAPYADVDAILITHWHEDHFSPEAVTSIPEFAT